MEQIRSQLLKKAGTHFDNSLQEPMQDFLKSNRLFVSCVVAVVILSLIFVYLVGFESMLLQAGHPERLKDITFYIWDKYPFAKHGCLVFLSIDDFEKEVAYSNHSSAYLVLMYVLYKIETSIPVLPMRATGAFLNILSLVVVTVYIASNLEKRRIGFYQGVLFLLSLAFMITMPAFWISAGRFNVDNPFPLMFSALMLVAFLVASDRRSGMWLWLSVLFLSFLAPIAAALSGAFLLLLAIREEGADRQLVKLSVVTILVSAIVYLQPVIVSKLLGFTTSNSGWLFRSGLDGDRRYFSNVWGSIFSPYFPRPPHLLLVPISLLLTQMLTIAKKNGVSNCFLTSSTWNASIFYAVLFSQYILTCLFWPQAVSIHPYLYDYELLAPVCVWIVFNFLVSDALQDRWRFWALVLMFLISFNLQQIAQANCSGCYYPAWTGNQLKLQ